MNCQGQCRQGRDECPCPEECQSDGFRLGVCLVTACVVIGVAVMLLSVMLSALG